MDPIRIEKLKDKLKNDREKALEFNAAKKQILKEEKLKDKKAMKDKMKDNFTGVIEDEESSVTKRTRRNNSSPTKSETVDMNPEKQKSIKSALEQENNINGGEQSKSNIIILKTNKTEKNIQHPKMI